jgi:hypothetical protein
MPKEQWLGSAILLASVLTTAVNEQRLVRHASSLEEGRKHVVSLSKPVVVAQNEGQLVHFSGVITTDPSVLAADSTASRVPYVLDPVFGIAARGVRLYRTVEMLQWVETVHTIAGSDPMAGDDDRDGGVDEHREKTYIYDLRWRSERIDSMSFHDIGYQNPPEDAWVFQSKVMDSDAVVVGDFELSRELIDQIKRRDPIELDAKTMQTMRIVLNQRIGEDWSKASALKDVSVEDKYFYLLRDGSARPSLGDIRVSFKVTPPYPVTVSGKQKAQQILPYATKAGESILILEDGILTATELYDNKLAIKVTVHFVFFARLMLCGLSNVSSTHHSTSTTGSIVCSRRRSDSWGFSCCIRFSLLASAVALPAYRSISCAVFSGSFSAFLNTQGRWVLTSLNVCDGSGGTTFSVAGLVWVLHRYAPLCNTTGICNTSRYLHDRGATVDLSGLSCWPLEGSRRRWCWSHSCGRRCSVNR